MLESLKKFLCLPNSEGAIRRKNSQFEHSSTSESLHGVQSLNIEALKSDVRLHEKFHKAWAYRANWQATARV